LCQRNYDHLDRSYIVPSFHYSIIPVTNLGDLYQMEQKTQEKQWKQ